MLTELGAVEQRYRAVLEVLEEGASVTEVARRYGVVRQTVHTWLRRYAEDGLAGLWRGPLRAAAPCLRSCYRQCAGHEGDRSPRFPAPQTTLAEPSGGSPGPTAGQLVSHYRGARDSTAIAGPAPAARARATQPGRRGLLKCGSGAWAPARPRRTRFRRPHRG